MTFLKIFCIHNYIKMRTRDNCFSEHKDKDEKCYGLHGGDSWSEDYCYECMDCPHLSLVSTTDV